MFNINGHYAEQYPKAVHNSRALYGMYMWLRPNKTMGCIYQYMP